MNQTAEIWSATERAVLVKAQNWVKIAARNVHKRGIKNWEKWKISNRRVCMENNKKQNQFYFRKSGRWEIHEMENITSQNQPRNIVLLSREQNTPLIGYMRQQIAAHVLWYQEKLNVWLVASKDGHHIQISASRVFPSEEQGNALDPSVEPHGQKQQQERLHPALVTSTGLQP